MCAFETLPCEFSVAGLNEVKVIVRVTDVNDNVPRFTITGKPIVAAVPATANYGYQIIRLQVDIRYFIPITVLL